jgi:hypothetical protein
MGHCEMLLAVAGLDPKALEDRTRLLASKDWSTLPPSDRAAFFFAKKFSKAPWTIDDADRERLIAHFGRRRTLDVLWWASRCHYMTRVADGFQLPLEQENVFAQRTAAAEKAAEPEKAEPEKAEPKKD